MGGLGSGGWQGPRKALVEDHLDLDVLELHRERRLEPGEWCYWTWRRGNRVLLTVMIQALDDGVELAYPPITRRRDRYVRQTRYDVDLEWTACTFGGHRPWFVCPGVTDGVACGRRAAKLYYRDGLFLCRLCQDLSYASQGRILRIAPLRKAQGIRLRLGGSLDIRDPFPPRPKGMHRATHARLHDEYLAALEEHLGVTGAYLGQIDGMLGGLLGGLFPDRSGLIEAGCPHGIFARTPRGVGADRGRSGARFPLTDMLCMHDRSDREKGRSSRRRPGAE